jgi:hypothetical protein
VEERRIVKAAYSVIPADFFTRFVFVEGGKRSHPEIVSRPWGDGWSARQFVKLAQRRRVLHDLSESSL